MYYDKLKRGIVFTPNENTIDWNDDSLALYREYSKNLGNELYSCNFSEDGMPIVTKITEEELAERKQSEFLKEESERQKGEAQAYLSSTDWYVVRKYERGVEIPLEVSEERARCVEVLNG